ncbi:uncharacterized protein RSE6_08869 [Rhynchosporium secalis]|uniref:FAR1 domain-containing protein n=1 Tax=Rhynchosporium secalis TaxID=38038 RepID=A0A1E1MGJ0_RHYSE|nr:uncharacterized protein RSE6_08869 [Rhynchosporium secalis]
MPNHALFDVVPSISIPCGPAPPIAIYSDIPTGFTAIQAYARAHGYTLRQRDIRLFRALFVCDCAGKYDPKGKQLDVDTSKRRKDTRSKKCDCQIRVTLMKDRASEQYSLAKAGISNAQILSALREEALGASILLLSKDISNLVQAERKRELGGKTPIQ